MASGSFSERRPAARAGSIRLAARCRSRGLSGRDVGIWRRTNWRCSCWTRYSEGAHRGLGRPEDRDRRLVERCRGRILGDLAQPGREHRALRAARLASICRGCHRGCHLARIDAGRRSVDHQHGVEIWRLQQHLQGRRIGVAARIRPEIHRARQRGDLAHGSGDRHMDRRRRPHQRPAADQQCVGRELGRPMTVGEQREPALAQPVAAACGAWAQAGGSGEQLLDRADPDQASPSEGGVVDLVPAQAQTGAAGALRRRAELPAGLENEHGLDAGGGARSRHEAPRVGDAFEMDQDGPGRDVQGEVVQNVAQLHLRKLAHGGNAGEADLPRGRPFEHGGRDRIRLGDESEVARRRHHRGRARVELPPRHDHADPIRADQAQPVRSCCRPRRACPPRRRALRRRSRRRAG